MGRLEIHKHKTRWIKPEPLDQAEIAELAAASGITPISAEILFRRGHTSPEKIRSFLDKDMNTLHDPFLLPGMGKAVDRILRARECGERVVIYGDYDCDGVTSTFTLLTTFRALGINADYYIPNRLDEGYGLNSAAVPQLAREYQLLVSVDSGITACEQVMLANSLGLDVVITDHHTPGSELPPALAVVNPKISESIYPFTELAGVGVAYKLAVALWRSAALSEDTFPVPLSVVMLGTVADIVPLVDENRSIVAQGLAELSTARNYGLQALIAQTKYPPEEITAGQVGFQLAPRINAAGRLGQADLALQLLLSTDQVEAMQIAAKLSKLNNERQEIEVDILAQALQAANQTHQPGDKAVVVAGQGWHSGVVGIVASRLVEEYHCPVVVISLDGDQGHGSVRSVPGVNIYDALSKCQQFLIGFGGHSQAAGLTIEERQIALFRQALCAVIDEMATQEDLLPQVPIDAVVSSNQLSEELVAEFKDLEPFGCGNPRPCLALEGVELRDSRTVGRDKSHLKIVVGTTEREFDGIGFGLGDWAEILKRHCGEIDVAFVPDINEWQGQRSLQLQIRDLHLPEEELSPIDQLFLAEQAAATDPYSNIGDAEEFYTKAVGVTFEGRQETLALLKPGEKLHLVREESNPHDSNAIRIEREEGRQVGYLRREIAKHLAPLIDGEAAYQATVSQITGGEAGQSLGVNLFVRREADPEEYLSWLESQNARESLVGLSDLQLRSAIKKAIIGGYDYRDKQLEAMESLLSGQNTLLIMGTGRGKSAVFQSVAAYKALKEGKSTIIIYPLRALVNDQYRSMRDKLGALGIRVFKATGSLNTREREDLALALHLGEAEVILATPEFVQCNLANYPELVSKLGLFVVDESHHIGKVNGNRSAYRQLDQLRRALQAPLTLAVTATADDEVAAGIIQALSVDNLIIDSHIRSNLQVVDSRGLEERAKFQYLCNLVGQGEKSIIYVNSREGASNLARDLRRALKGTKDQIAFYHGGLANSLRVMVEELFARGELRTVVATSAFGEGVDIPDIRHVLHYHLTFNSTDFNQQSGRAGRDGGPAKVHLLYSPQDAEINRFILKSKAPDREVLGALYRSLQGTADNRGEVSLSNAELAEVMQGYLSSASNQRFRPSPETVSAGLGVLYELGLLSREKAGSARIIYLAPKPEGKLDLIQSVRYNEGIIEKEAFESFQEWALKSPAPEILALINKPIYPTKLA